MQEDASTNIHVFDYNPRDHHRRVCHCGGLHALRRRRGSFLREEERLHGENLLAEFGDRDTIVGVECEDFIENVGGVLRDDAEVLSEERFVSPKLPASSATSRRKLQ